MQNEQETPKDSNLKKQTTTSEDKNKKVDKDLYNELIPLESTVLSVVQNAALDLNSIKTKKGQNAKKNPKIHKYKNFSLLPFDKENFLILSTFSNRFPADFNFGKNQFNDSFQPYFNSFETSAVASLTTFHLNSPKENSTKEFLQKVQNHFKNSKVQNDCYTNHDVYFHQKEQPNFLSSTLDIGLIQKDNIGLNQQAASSDILLMLQPKNHSNEAISNLSHLNEITSIHYTNDEGAMPILTQLCKQTQAGLCLNLKNLNHPHPEKYITHWLTTESQFQYIVTIKKEAEDIFKENINAFNFSANKIGYIKESDHFEIYVENEKLFEIPITTLLPSKESKNKPRQIIKPKYLKRIKNFSLKKINTPKDLIKAAKQLFLAPNIVSTRWAFVPKEENVLKSKSCAVVAPISNQGKFVAIASVNNPNQVYATPIGGAMNAVIIAIRKIICSGAKPLGIIPQQNFGDITNPDVYWQYANILQGIEEACKRLEIPLMAGNTRFFSSNKTEQPAEFAPVPLIHAIGNLAKEADQMPMEFQEEGDLIYMLGNAQNDLGGSEYLRTVCKIKHSPCPTFDLLEARELNQHLQQIIAKKFPKSINEISHGGLFIALINSAMVRGLGFKIETIQTYRRDAFLFGESQNRVILTISPEKEKKFLSYLISNNLTFAKLGEVFENEVNIDNKNYGDIAKWRERHLNYLSEKM